MCKEYYKYYIPTYPTLPDEYFTNRTTKYYTYLPLFATNYCAMLYEWFDQEGIYYHTLGYQEIPANMPDDATRPMHTLETIYNGDLTFDLADCRVIETYLTPTQINEMMHTIANTINHEFDSTAGIVYNEAPYEIWGPRYEGGPNEICYEALPFNSIYLFEFDSNKLSPRYSLTK